MGRIKIQQVSPEQLQKMLRQYAPRGRFLAKDGCKWVALDNSTCDAWVEEFSRKRQAVRWLLGKFEVGDKAKQRVRINEAGRLIETAQKQGVELNTEEADMILGYLEGHDYCLMVDAEGATVRHDEQYGDSHRGDETYIVQDAIQFCQEMNWDLLRDGSALNERDRAYSAHLRKDKQLLDALMERAVTLCQPWEV